MGTSCVFALVSKTPWPAGFRSRWRWFHCSSEPLITNSSPPPPQSWEPVRKKKVVMRVGYVGTNYRGDTAHTFPSIIHITYTSSPQISFLINFSGLQMQRDQHSLSSMLPFSSLLSILLSLLASCYMCAKHLAVLWGAEISFD